MNYPQPPYGQQPQGYPGQQAPNYAPQPGYPAQPQQQPYAPNYGPYPPQGVQPQPEPVRGTLQDFMNQPSTGGGPSLSFQHPGTSYTGTVIRNVTDADIQAQTDLITGTVGKYSDGRPKLLMKVPLLLHQPNPAYPEGVGVWYVKGNDRAELARAMEAAGAEAGPPQAGDVITITYTHDQPGRRGMNPTKIKRVDYVKGNGVAPQMPQAQQAAPQPQYQAYTPQPQYRGTYSAPQPPQGAYYDPAQAQAMQAYQQATGQPLPPTAPAAANPYVASAPPMTPPAPGYAQVPPTPAAPAAPPPSPAQPTAPASPSYQVPGGPPPDWPADVPFVPGLTPAQAAIAQRMGHPAASGQ